MPGSWEFLHIMAKVKVRVHLFLKLCISIINITQKHLLVNERRRCRDGYNTSIKSTERRDL